MRGLSKRGSHACEREKLHMLVSNPPCLVWSEYGGVACGPVAILYLDLAVTGMRWRGGNFRKPRSYLYIAVVATFRNPHRRRKGGTVR